MFIMFFGTRPGKKKEKTLKGVSCPFCNQEGQLRATLIPQYIHLFWIPVYRLRPEAYVECAHCRKVYDGQGLSPEMQQHLDQLKNQ